MAAVSQHSVELHCVVCLLCIRDQHANGAPMNDGSGRHEIRMHACPAGNSAIRNRNYFVRILGWALVALDGILLECSSCATSCVMSSMPVITPCRLQPGSKDGAFAGPLGGLFTASTATGSSGGAQQQSRGLLSDDDMYEQLHHIFTEGVDTTDNHQGDACSDVGATANSASDPAGGAEHGVRTTAGLHDTDDIMQQLYDALIKDIGGHDGTTDHAAHSTGPAQEPGVQPGAESYTTQVNDDAEWEVVS